MTAPRQQQRYLKGLPRTRRDRLARACSLANLRAHGLGCRERYPATRTLLPGFAHPADRHHDGDVPADELLPPASLAEAHFLLSARRHYAHNQRRLTMNPAIVSREQWLDARKALLAKERAMTHQLDALRAERRQLPWVKDREAICFSRAPTAPCTLGDLFHGRSQLAVYHFMLTPGSDSVCRGCSFVADHIDAARQHFEHADLSFTAISRVPLQRIDEVKRRMGWTFPWVSSQASDFNFDFGVSFTPEDIAAGRAIYNYGTVIRSSQDMFGVQHLREGRHRRHLPHLLNLPPRRRIADGRTQLARSRSRRPQRKRRHHELGAAARRILNPETPRSPARAASSGYRWRP